MTAATRDKPRPPYRLAALGLAVLALVCASRSEAQQRPKKIGFSVQVQTSGLTRTTVAKIVVTQVAPDSQAQAGGVVAGDELLRIDSTIVPGNSVFALKAHMGFEPGVPKSVTFRHADGAQFNVVFVRSPGS